MSAWRKIDSAPRDGTRILLGKIVGNPNHDTALWWAVVGHWSDKWNNWNDGVEPCGLADPTHWIPISAHGAAEPMVDWFPISTAPKDQRLLGYLPEYGVGSMFWQRVRTTVNGVWTDLCGWRIHGMLIEENHDNQPTHWMPLPEGPK